MYIKEIFLYKNMLSLWVHIRSRGLDKEEYSMIILG